MERQAKVTREIVWDLDNIPPKEGFRLLATFMKMGKDSEFPLEEFQPFMELAAGKLDPPLKFSEYVANFQPFTDMLGVAFKGIGGDADDPKVSGSASSPAS